MSNLPGIPDFVRRNQPNANREVWHHYPLPGHSKSIDDVIAAAVLAERESCAKVVLTNTHAEYPSCKCEFCEMAEEIAEAIRARGR